MFVLHLVRLPGEGPTDGKVVNTPPSKPMRLQKFLAACGIASRRAAEGMIADGRVVVNGTTVLRQGTLVATDRDVVLVDGAAVRMHDGKRRAIVLHKPRGYVCSAAPGEGRTIYELLRDVPTQLAYAGRLDRNSEGLVVLSNDGDLVLRLTHPRFGHEKTYRVTVSGRVDDAALARLNAPMLMEGYRTRPARVSVLKAGDKAGRTILEIVLCEGRHHQVREMCRQCGLEVHRLVRTAIGGVSLRGLCPGAWRDLSEEEVGALALAAK
jgi:23S rRNA pseudouridine2605 synthase